MSLLHPTTYSRQQTTKINHHAKKKERNKAPDYLCPSPSKTPQEMTPGWYCSTKTPSPSPSPSSFLLVLGLGLGLALRSCSCSFGGDGWLRYHVPVPFKFKFLLPFPFPVPRSPLLHFAVLCCAVLCCAVFRPVRCGAVRSCPVPPAPFRRISFVPCPPGLPPRIRCSALHVTHYALTIMYMHTPLHS
ncbi:hypothetical protein CC80DRAFT_153657 [Byssothecium circinans]|uniref:Uncharacterized protein n=1 Tax=Byssothecium circinans TaxID=147558 RepID=A0A6A5UAX7_9PLEO|nr:hypothetical protein CC80DRAFT_153657 [Byssothecium circinans]